MDRRLSRSAMERARILFPGGVNSPVRSFSAVGGEPVVMVRGEGPWLYDVDGNRYIDFVMSWGAVMLGHAHQSVRAAASSALTRGMGFGFSTREEASLAELIREAFPSIEMLRMVNSGTEAVMSALRTARGFTGRDKVVTFGGCYHGHSDALLVEAGSGLATLGIPRSAGVPQAFVEHTLVARYNDLDSVKHLAERFADEIACILVEPVAGNMGVVEPAPGFLEGLQEVCRAIGALLIFDEVITGFRLCWGGAQHAYGVRPDMTVLGKIIGGGLPVGAFGGRRDVMESLAPVGRVYQAGTLSGNPVVMSAGLETLRLLRDRQPYDALERKADLLTGMVVAAAKARGVALHVGRSKGMFTFFFSEDPAGDFETARKADADRYARFFRNCLDRGVLLPPSQWETAFVSAAHLSEEVIEQAGEVFDAALDGLA